MKIVYIVPGSGGAFYCENCVRDIDLVHALRKLGHEVIIVPMYLPLSDHTSDTASVTPVYYGAINIYLKQILPFFNKCPSWIERFLDTPLFLNIASKKAGSTRASTLGEMTISMLRGEEGKQADELKKLVTMLRDEIKPDLVHLSNALLLGVARSIKEETGAAIVCSLQDEHTWINEMEEKDAHEVWRTMSKRTESVDAFVPVSRYYAKEMQGVLGITSELMHVVYNGIELDYYRPHSLSFDVPTIGFLSRMSHSQGLGILSEAFIELKKNSRLQNAKLKIAGGYTKDDRIFIRGLKKLFAKKGVLGDVEFIHGFDRDQRINFLRSISILSVPATGGIAFGTYLVEALALGVPAVQPEMGGFAEIVSATGGGILYSPNDARSLSVALSELLLDPKRAYELGRRGSKWVHKNLNIEYMARKMITIYEKSTGIKS
jgi:glycosyltransferase involved in cell wall biosynthesis